MYEITKAWAGIMLGIFLIGLMDVIFIVATLISMLIERYRR